MLDMVEAVKPGTVPTGVVYHLDKPLPGEVLAEGQPLELRGWVWSPEQPVERIEVSTDAGQRRSFVLDQLRPLLNRRLGLGGAVTLGFRVALDRQLARGRIHVSGLSRSGEPLHLCSIDMRELAEAEAIPKRLFFMHIAKTAGSSVNAFVRQYYPSQRCVDHVESYHLRPGMDVAELRNKLYVSGHVTLEVARMRGYVSEWFKSFTLLRKPEQHLLSHICWVKRLALPEFEAECARHPAYIQDMAQRLNSMDLEAFIASMGELESNLFDNAQTRYLANTFSSGLDDSHLELALRALRSFDLVGINEEFGQSMRVLARFMGWGDPMAIPRENVATHKRDWSDLGIDPGHPALRRLLRYDELAHDEACRLFELAKRRWLDQEAARTPPRRRQEAI